MSARLDAAVRGLLATARDAYTGTPAHEHVVRATERLGAPLRVAIAGKVKSGKSTLLNALVGDLLAPTDASECTRIVTWYQDGPAYRVVVESAEGPPEQVRFGREDGALTIDLDAHDADTIERIVVDWPSASLREMTLIDTPGIASASTEVSHRTHRFLTPTDTRATAADAVLYLMRHAHSSDYRFLESFHDEEVAQATPVNAIGVLSRADEVGVGRLDAMSSARRIAGRYRADPQLRRLCQTVVPVAGLVAETAATLREDEFRALRRLSGLERDDLDELVLSADRFVDAAVTVEDLEVGRRELIERLGLFGVRTALALLRQGAVTTAAELAEELQRRSGIEELRRVLVQQFALRRSVLKARAVLAILQSVLAERPDRDVAAELERVVAGANEFAELRLLNAVRAGRVRLDEDDAAEIERLLGAAGPSAQARLGLAPDAMRDEIRERAIEYVLRWQRRAENPVTSKAEADAARVVVRCLEGLLTPHGAVAP